MAANILNNFVTIRKTRGDVLNPTEYRTIVEMIQGIYKKYDFSSFNEAYQDFLNHLINYQDPHHDTQNSFYPEFLSRIYGIYTKMTASPMSEADFNTNVVPSTGLLELIRRIILNRYLYDTIKLPNGSVPTEVTVYLTSDWNRSILPNVPILLTFPAGITNETQFLRCGWVINSNPIAVVFNADELDLAFTRQTPLFHTSSASPFLTINTQGVNYSISLPQSSNDLSVKLQLVGTPIAKTTVFSLLNGTETISIAYDTNNRVEVKFGATVAFTAVNCGDGKLILSLTKKGKLTLLTSHNGTRTTSEYQLTFTNVRPFITGSVGALLETRFGSTFGIRELSVVKDVNVVVASNTPIPIIFTLPPSGVTPVIGTTSVDVTSAILSAVPGYKVYLTLTGTWTGTIKVQRSINGITWTNITAHDGNPVGVYTVNCNEAIVLNTIPDEEYRVVVDLNTGTVNYRLAQ